MDAEENKDNWDLYVDHDSSPSRGGEDHHPRVAPAWDTGIWMIEAGPADGNWASLDALVVLSHSANAAEFMLGERDDELRGAPLNPNPKDRFYSGSLAEYKERGPVPRAALTTLGHCGVRAWPGDDDKDGFIRWVAGVPVERTARSMLFVCVDVKVHGPITEDTVKRLEAAQAFDWYRRKNRTHKQISDAKRDLVPISAWKAQLDAAEKLDDSLMLISRAGFSTYQVVAWNAIFEKMIKRHGFDNEKRLSVRLETRVTGDADWIETEKHTLVVFAWLDAEDTFVRKYSRGARSTTGSASGGQQRRVRSGWNSLSNSSEEETSSLEALPKAPTQRRQREPSQQGGERPAKGLGLAKRLKTTADSSPRSLPLLLEAVPNWNPSAKDEGPGLFCVRIVAEQYYQQALPTPLWLWFPGNDAAYFSDDVWRRLGWPIKDDAVRLPPHAPTSLFDVVDGHDAAKMKAALARSLQSRLKKPSMTKSSSSSSSRPSSGQPNQQYPPYGARAVAPPPSQPQPPRGHHHHRTTTSSSAVSEENAGDDNGAFDLRLSTRTRSGAWIDLRWQGVPLLWNKDNSSIFVVAGCVVEATFESSSQLAFANNVSREIGGPLDALSGSLEHLRDQRTNESIYSLLYGVVNGAIDQLNATMDRVLDFAHLGSGRTTLVRAPTSVSALLADVRARLVPVASQKRVILAPAVIPENFPNFVNVDTARLDQIYSNCLIAAIKVTDQAGSVKTVVDLLPPDEDDDQPLQPGGEESLPGFGQQFSNHSSSSSASNVIHPPATFCRFRIVVHDAGRGVPQREWETVFETSLGMSISRRLVALHGGKIHVAASDIVGHGTAITIELRAPVVTSSSQEPPVSQGGGPQQSPQVSSSTTQQRVLVPPQNTAAAVAAAAANLQPATTAPSPQQQQPPVNQTTTQPPTQPSPSRGAPVATAQDEDAPASSSLSNASSSSASDDTRRLRQQLPTALIVDESETNRTILALHLRKLRSDVALTFARSGREAVDLVLADPAHLQQVSFAWIFIDLHAPGVDGVAATRLLRRDRQVRIVGLSNGDVDAHAEQAGLDAGMVAILVKPSSSAQIRAALLDVLDHEEQRRQQSSGSVDHFGLSSSQHRTSTPSSL